MAGRPGASAQREYDRRRTNLKERRRRRLPFTLVLLVFAPLLAWTLVDAFLPGVGKWAAGLAFLTLLSDATVQVRSTESWSIGASGERRTARALEGLGLGYAVLHDRKMSGRRSNIDHLVIGPCGVFVVETKSYSGKVRVRRREVFVNGRRRTGIVDQVLGQSRAVEEVLFRAGLGAVPVTPVLCFHRAHLLRRTRVGHVRFVGRRGLRKAVTAAGARADAEQVIRAAAVLDEQLRPG
ncbi:MAG TPA: nuclease-related domain-containing protein [Actinomycetota bacterium]|nr:nuclease-related domain-containing protein [Actinomycetota bacterium]